MDKRQVIMLEKYKTIEEVKKSECAMEYKNCILCQYKYPYKANFLYDVWEGAPICMKAEKTAAQTEGRRVYG